MKVPLFPRRLGATILVLLSALVPGSCDTGGPEIPNVDGKWVGSVPDLELELTMTLLGQLQDKIIGVAEFVSPALGRVDGNISGTQAGMDVDLSIHLDEPRVAGVVVFDGVFENRKTLSGTVDSGLLQGSWPVTLSREKN